MREQDEIAIKPAHLVALVMAVGTANLAFTGLSIPADPATREQVEALQARIEVLQERVAKLQQTGPEGVIQKLNDVQATVDSCMPCHLQQHKIDPNHFKGEK